MTMAYEEFMRQYAMSGREKADGYTAAAFTGLEPHEKDEVFKKLVAELPSSANGLSFSTQRKPCL